MDLADLKDLYWTSRIEEGLAIIDFRWGKAIAEARERRDPFDFDLSLIDVLAHKLDLYGKWGLECVQSGGTLAEYLLWLQKAGAELIDWARWAGLLWITNKNRVIFDEHQAGSEKRMRAWEPNEIVLLGLLHENEFKDFERGMVDRINKRFEQRYDHWRDQAQRVVFTRPAVITSPGTNAASKIPTQYTREESQTIGRNILAVLRASGLTLAALLHAARDGLDPSTVYRWKRGEQRARFDNVAAIADAFSAFELVLTVDEDLLDENLDVSKYVRHRRSTRINASKHQ